MDFHSVFYRIVSLASPDLADYLRNRPRLGRFAMYGSWIMLEYWFVKAPMIYMLTDVLSVWYVASAFIAGTICTIIGFFLSEFGIWRKVTKKNEV